MRWQTFVQIIRLTIFVRESRNKKKDFVCSREVLTKKLPGTLVNT